MPGKASKARYRAMLADVERRVAYAFASGEHANPYPEDDKRFPRFARELQRTLIVDAEFRDVHEAYGGDVSALVPRKIPKPGPVVPYEQLA